MKALYTLVFFASAARVRCDDADDDCTPAIAERCFNGFWNETLYNPNGIDDICRLAYDRITCTQDIIDDGCQKKEDLHNFDTWVSGLMAVYSYLCKSQPKQLEKLLQHVEPQGHCFNLTSFVSCVERKARVTHVTDMIVVRMDAVECNWILISVATCSVTSRSTECAHIQDIISEVVQIFFQEVKCAYLCGESRHLQVASATLLLSVLFQIFK